MRTLLIILVVILAAVAGGYAVCLAAGWNAPLREMIVAAGACLVAGVLGCGPMVLTRGAAQPDVAQAGLLGTVLHLLACTVLGGGVMVLHPLRLESPYVYWLLGLYWLTLIVLAAGYVHAVRVAPPATSSTTATATAAKQT